MAFVAITAGQIVLQSDRGNKLNLSFTRAASVGLCTFSRNGQTFVMLPAGQNWRIVDAYIGDAVNAADYLEIYVNGTPRPDMRLWENAINDATTIPRITPSVPIAGGAQLELYHQSA